MLFGTPQSGGNIVSGLNMTDLRTGDFYQLMVATDTVVTGSSSVAFVLGNRPDGGTITKTFFVTGCTNNTEWTIQCSNGPATEDVSGSPTSTLNNFDATFQDIILSDTTGNGVFTDTGASQYYRFHVKVLQSGDHPVANVRIG